MPSVCLYFQVHQPHRIKRYRIFDVGNNHKYFDGAGDDDTNNARVLKKVAKKSYLPTNEVLLELLKNHPKFKVSFSLSGVLLDQLAEHAPEVLKSFKRLADTGRAEFLNETYYHSLASIYSPDEFEHQVALHRRAIFDYFGQVPSVFRNTELIYRNDIAARVAEMGYSGILAEGADHILGWRSPNYLYTPVGAPHMKLLLKNYRLSDDIAFRFSSREWSEYPLTAEKFAQWVGAINGAGEVVNLFMDYETFGEHQWEDTGIFDFLRALPREILRHPDNDFVTPSEAVTRYTSRGELDVPYYVSWADIERDLSAWLGNGIQHEAIEKLYALEGSIKATGDNALIEDWRRLQTSDHFYYMCTKWFADGDVHKYFNPYESPYEAFIAFMNVLSDIELRIQSV